MEEWQTDTNRDKGKNSESLVGLVNLADDGSSESTR